MSLHDFCGARSGTYWVNRPTLHYCVCILAYTIRIDASVRNLTPASEVCAEWMVHRLESTLIVIMIGIDKFGCF